MPCVLPASVGVRLWRPASSFRHGFDATPATTGDTVTLPVAVPDRILVTTGTGRAETELAALDRAYHAAGIHDANIVRVSSVIPPEATVTVDADRDAVADAVEIGGVYPMVVADVTSDGDGDRLAAGIGIGELARGYGVNVEAHGIDRSESVIRRQCRESLSELADTRNTTLDSATSRVATASVADSGATAAVAAAVYL